LIQKSIFCAEFDGSDQSAYFLASSAKEAADWIGALRGASYAHLKKRYLDLEAEAKQLRTELEE